MYMKGTKIAIFHISSYVSLLEEHRMTKYKGFTPINSILTPEQYRSIYPVDKWALYSDYVRKFNIHGSPALTQLGVESTTRIPYPLIFN